jgi:hypothetical protein
MTKVCCAVCTMIFVASVIEGSLFAQDPPSLLVSPEKVTMLTGDTHTFRAVGKDGRMRHPVRWRVSPEDAVTLTLRGDEATLQANHPSSKVVLTAFAGDDSAEASIEVRSGSLTPGTVMWSVPEVPGCKNRKMSQAVPSANGPDLYVEEDCPQGTLIRALTADGREMWRTGLGASGAHLSAAPASKVEAQPGQHLNLGRNSVCDVIALGMTKEKVANLVDARNLRLEDKQRQRDSWFVEEEGARCEILFDGRTEAVVKRKKTLVTE